MLRVGLRGLAQAPGCLELLAAPWDTRRWARKPPCAPAGLGRRTHGPASPALGELQGPMGGAWQPVPAQLCWGGRARRGTQMPAPWAQDVPTGAQAGSPPAPMESVAARGNETWGARGRPCQGTACPLYPRVRRLLGQACPLGMQQGRADVCWPVCERETGSVLPRASKT